MTLNELHRIIFEDQNVQALKYKREYVGPEEAEIYDSEDNEDRNDLS